MHIILRIIIYIHHKYFNRMWFYTVYSWCKRDVGAKLISFHLSSGFYFAVFLFYSSILSWSEIVALTWFTTALKINLKEKITCASYLWGHTVISEHVVLQNTEGTDICPFLWRRLPYSLLQTATDTYHCIVFYIICGIYCRVFYSLNIKVVLLPREK